MLYAKESWGTRLFDKSPLIIQFVNQDPEVNPPCIEVLALPQCDLYIIQPPDYASVLKMEEEGLPDYHQAVEEGSETGVAVALK